MGKHKVALVTGASRGAGAGIARGLGELGYTVYVTGRTVAPGDAKGWDGSVLPGTVSETAAKITELGGKGSATMPTTRRSPGFSNRSATRPGGSTFWSTTPPSCTTS